MRKGNLFAGKWMLNTAREVADHATVMCLQFFLSSFITKTYRYNCLHSLLCATLHLNVYVRFKKAQYTCMKKREAHTHMNTHTHQIQPHNIRTLQYI